MKFGHHLKENVAPDYGPEAYLNYSNLDGLIRVLNSKSLSRYVKKGLIDLFKEETSMDNVCHYIFFNGSSVVKV